MAKRKQQRLPSDQSGIGARMALDAGSYVWTPKFPTTGTQAEFDESFEQDQREAMERAEASRRQANNHEAASE